MFHVSIRNDKQSTQFIHATGALEGSAPRSKPEILTRVPQASLQAPRAAPPSCRYAFARNVGGRQFVGGSEPR
jgi:hypothetical protein